MFGDELPIPPIGNTLEDHLSVEIMEAIPRHIQLQCRSYGIFSTIEILVQVMREAMPTRDFSR
eukprot:12544151-Prorocentrum_lima.AAC.1